MSITKGCHQAIIIKTYDNKNYEMRYRVFVNISYQNVIYYAVHKGNEIAVFYSGEIKTNRLKFFGGTTDIEGHEDRIIEAHKKLKVKCENFICNLITASK